MSNDTLERMVGLRTGNSKMAVTVLKKIYVDEAKHVAHDISARLCQFRLLLTSNLAQSREADDSSRMLGASLGP